MELNKPGPFSPSNKVETAKEWKRWRQEFLIYLRLSGGYDDYSEEERALFLQNIMGIESIKAMEKMTFNDENERKDMDILLMKFDEIFDPPSNEAEERYKFFSRRKNSKETIEEYVSDLETISSRCNFGQQTNKFITDMVIQNMDVYLRKNVFTVQNITLPDVIDFYRIYELDNQKIIKISADMIVRNHDSENLKEKESSNFSFVTKEKFKNYCLKCHSTHDFNVACKKESSMDNKSKQKRTCSKCGTNHPYKHCPAYDTVCQNCFEKGHYTDKCKQVKTSNFVPQAVRDPSIKNKQFTASSNINSQDKNCDWCELKHGQGQCKHDVNCKNCDAFPHKICFECKKNPHDLYCYFRNIVSLPPKLAVNSKDFPKKPVCAQCGLHHEVNQCAVLKKEESCHSQNTTRPYPSFRNNSRINNSSRSNQMPFEEQRKSFSARSPPPFFKSNQKKNEKSDCCIS